MFNKHDYKILSMKFNINKKAKPVQTFKRKFLIEGIVTKTLWNLGKIMATWQKQNNLLSLLGLKQVVRLIGDDKKMTMMRDENGGDPCPWALIQRNAKSQAKPTPRLPFRTITEDFKAKKRHSRILLEPSSAHKARWTSDMVRLSDHHHSHTCLTNIGGGGGGAIRKWGGRGWVLKLGFTWNITCKGEYPAVQLHVNSQLTSSHLWALYYVQAAMHAHF
jgi:hypothetical protein